MQLKEHMLRQTLANFGCWRMNGLLENDPPPSSVATQILLNVVPDHYRVVTHRHSLLDVVEILLYKVEIPLCERPSIFNKNVTQLLVVTCIPSFKTHEQL